MKTSNAHAWEAHVSRMIGPIWRVSIYRRDLVVKSDPQMRLLGLRSIEIMPVVVRRYYAPSKTVARILAQTAVDHLNRNCGTHEPIARVVNA